MAKMALTDRYGRLHAKVDTYTKGRRIVTEMARSASPRLMKNLIEIAETHEDVHVRMHATEMIFNRAFGKPKQEVEVAGEVQHSFVVRLPMTLDQAQWEAKFGPRTIEALEEPDTAKPEPGEAK